MLKRICTNMMNVEKSEISINYKRNYLCLIQHTEGPKYLKGI